MMKYFISPSMKMKPGENFTSLQQELLFPKATSEVINSLQALTDQQRQDLWACSDRVAHDANEWVHKLSLDAPGSPAILTYQGIQYQAMAPDLMTEEQLKRLADRLRIVSGLYGLVAPLPKFNPIV